ncbi:MAG: UDP-N-acetylmuramate dehydrogenase [Lachnospiraceae bacterium]|nr:UDP-N-acetylmuramate dehydrogenase [Lachnospiraceae bacterium]
MYGIAEELRSITANVMTDEKMSAHTTFRTGGCADIFVIPKNAKEATDVVRLLLARNVPYTVIGNGSNILVSDEGYRGCIVCMGADDMNVLGTTVTAGAGALLSKVARLSYENGLTGLEFAAGIPGSVGGAVVMNAGAYGSEIKDVIKDVKLFDIRTQNMVRLSGEDLLFGYRTSIVKTQPLIVLEAVFELSHKDRSEIKETMDDLAARRRSKQPLEYPSAGSTFKRPEGHFAGKLIEEAGLKGYSVGGAAVSDKHCGFIINRDNAASSDIISLIRIVRQKVFESSGVMLEPEIVLLGEGLEL